MSNYQTFRFCTSAAERRSFFLRQGYEVKTYRRFFQDLGLDKKFINRFDESFLNINLVSRSITDRENIFSGLRQLCDNFKRRGVFREDAQNTTPIKVNIYTRQVYTNIEFEGENYIVSIVAYEEGNMFKRIICDTLKKIVNSK